MKMSDERKMRRVKHLKAKLTAMPKAPVEGVTAPILVQVKYCWLVSLVLPMMAGISYLGTQYGIDTDFWNHVMRSMLAIYAVVLLTLIMMTMWTLTLYRRLRHLASGHYFVHWLLTDDQLHDAQSKSSPNVIKFLLIGGAISTGAGLTAAGQAFADGKLFFATPFEHFTFTGIGFLMIGCALGYFFWKLAQLKHQFVTTHCVQVIVGPKGLYITGDFWSFDGTFQRLYDVSVSKEESRIEFKVGTSGEHAIRHEQISIPVPEGELPNARLLRQQLVAFLDLN